MERSVVKFRCEKIRKRSMYSEVKIRKMKAIVCRARGLRRVSIDGTMCYASVLEHKYLPNAYVMVGDYRTGGAMTGYITPPGTENKNMVVDVTADGFETLDDESRKHIMDDVRKNLELLAWAWYDCWVIEKGISEKRK